MWLWLGEELHLPVGVVQLHVEPRNTYSRCWGSFPELCGHYFHPSGFPSLISYEIGTCSGSWSHVHSHSQVTVWSVPFPKGLKSALCSWQASCPDVSLSDSAPSGETCYCYVSAFPFPSFPISQTCNPHHVESPLWLFLERVNGLLTFMGLVYIHMPSVVSPRALERLMEHSLTTSP